ncbi:hypothetical protein HYFRA_00003014 [Hymenoscyphus fraxineus]|uniref:Uncharacterized protein n=1 Tax=Hymenoscyphus fraxineus TaxID=746836 RepID=A0A9N9PPM9_9HELO|nr:hypothetical protein HYFRA_00003014 [Hymenoscyphus fraxineus]
MAPSRAVAAFGKKGFPAKLGNRLNKVRSGRVTKRGLLPAQRNCKNKSGGFVPGFFFSKANWPRFVSRLLLKMTVL